MDCLTNFNILEDNENNNQFASESFLDNLESNSAEEEIPNITNKQEENDTQVVIATPTELNQLDGCMEKSSEIVDWSISLSDVPKALRINEFGHTYIYGRLKDPDGLPTNKFHGFFKNNLSENSTWKSLPGVLSDRYVVVSLEKFINNVIKTKFENIVEYSVYGREPWKLAWIGTIENSQEYILEYINRGSFDLIFKNIAEADINIHSIVSNFGFVITNTYNGTNKLKISPIIKTAGIVADGDNLEFIDYFTFSNFTQVISHSSRYSDIEDDLITIKENISEHVSILKRFTDISSITRDISRCFRKPGKNTFESVLNGEARKNLLDVSIAASIALGKKYSIIEYLAIRSKIEAFLEQIF